MAERFERLYELPANLYSVGSPVIVSAGALLKDKQTESVIVQLKFQSVSSAPIKALKVGVVAYDVAGKEVDGVKEYQYLDLMVSNGQTFGSNKAIVMPNAVTRSFSIGSITVVQTDGVAKDVTMPITALPMATFLQSGLNDAELVKQYRLAVNNESTYIPQEADGLWMCSCGEWNREDFCTKCRAKKSIVFSAYDIPLLTEKANSRLAQKKAQREEQQRLAEIERQRKEEQERIAAKKRKKTAKKVKVATVILTPVIALILGFALWLYPDVLKPSMVYNEAMQLLDNGQYEEAIAAFQTLVDYKDSPERIEEATKAQAYADAEDLLFAGKTAESAIAFGRIADYSDAKARSFSLWENIIQRDSISTYYTHTVGLKTDGTVVAVGYNESGQCDVSSWTDIVSISAGDNHTVGLKSDGTVIAVGYNKSGQCDVADWADITMVSAGAWHTVGLKSDGTVVAVGANSNGQCDVSSWTDIVSISVGDNHTVGLKSDGTVVAVGTNSNGQCNVSGWTDILAISAGYYHTVGLKVDGTVVAVGDNEYGRCNVADWMDIVAISTGGSHTVGLKADGTVVATTFKGESIYNHGQCGVSDWTDIVAISAGCLHTVGLKADGTVVAVGNNEYGQCDVSEWKNIRIPN